MYPSYDFPAFNVLPTVLFLGHSVPHLCPQGQFSVCSVACGICFDGVSVIHFPGSHCTNPSHKVHLEKCLHLEIYYFSMLTFF